jgi:hypothetical protein
MGKMQKGKEIFAKFAGSPFEPDSECSRQAKFSGLTLLEEA